MLSRITQELLRDPSSGPRPLIRLAGLSTKRARIWLKPEWTDPCGSDPLRSIKRKPASLLLGDALEKGYFARNEVIVSATSGNLGIELGLLANARGVPFFAVVPADVPSHNLHILRRLGIHALRTAEASACPGRETVFFARRCAGVLGRKVVNLEQFNSWLNPLSHSLTTAPEVFDELEKVDYIVASMGSSGTASGIAQYVMSTRRKTRVIAVQPALDHGVPGTLSVRTQVTHGESRWSPENYSPAVVGERYLRTADTIDAYAYAAKLWQLGVPAGPSTGLALAHARCLVEHGTLGDIVVISPDNNFKYARLIAETLAANEQEIRARYPDLELDDTIAAYRAHLEEARGPEWTSARIDACYPARGEGMVFEARSVEALEEARRVVADLGDAPSALRTARRVRPAPVRRRRSTLRRASGAP